MVAAAFLLVGFDRVAPAARGTCAVRPMVVAGLGMLWPLGLQRSIAVIRSGGGETAEPAAAPSPCAPLTWLAFALPLAVSAAAALEVLGRDPDMGRFLSEQVVSSLPPEVRLFLLQIAALPKLSPELAIAVTGKQDARATFFALGGHALPFAMLNEGHHWLRFHPVFREFLLEDALRQGIGAAYVLRCAALIYCAPPPCGATPKAISATWLATAHFPR